MKMKLKQLALKPSRMHIPLGLLLIIFMALMFQDWINIRRYKLSAATAATTTGDVNVKSSSSKSPPPILWMTACETRQRDPGWIEMAKKFQKASMEGENPVEVRIDNVCHGVEWNGLLTKLEQLELFLLRTILAPNATNSIANSKTYIVFSDSDALLNTWSVPDASIVFERYHSIMSPGGHSLLLGAEPNCWLGDFCSKEDLQKVYPDAPNRTNCPFFINSGLFMGEPEIVLQMLQAVLHHSSSKTGTNSSSQQPHQEEIPSNLVDMYNSQDDQTRVAAWYSQNRHMATVDTTGSLFRNLLFGEVNKDSYEPTTVKNRPPVKGTCGFGGVKTCGFFLPAISGKVHQPSLEIVMDPVPSCQTEPRPWFIHGNGFTKDTMDYIRRKRESATEYHDFLHLQIRQQ